MYEINEKVEIVITRNESNFDRACESAWRRAIDTFGIDEFGHSIKVKGFQRSTDYIVTEFKTYKHTASMCGHTYDYIFEAYVASNRED
jgi:hypothetical protein